MKYTKALLELHAAQVDTWGDLYRAVGSQTRSGSAPRIKKLVQMYGIDVSHFRNVRYSFRPPSKSKEPLEYFMTKDSINIKSSKLRERLVSEGYKNYECEICKRTEWEGQPIPLELDHINSDHWDNRLENLQIICPNCHAVVTAERRHERVAKNLESQALVNQADC